MKYNYKYNFIQHYEYTIDMKWKTSVEFSVHIRYKILFNNYQVRYLFNSQLAKDEESEWWVYDWWETNFKKTNKINNGRTKREKNSLPQPNIIQSLKSQVKENFLEIRVK